MILLKLIRFLQKYQVNNYKNQYFEKITNISKYIEIKKKFGEMKCYLLENVCNVHFEIKMTEFYRSNKTDIDLLFIKLIEFYENILKKTRVLEKTVLNNHIQFLENSCVKVNKF